MSQFLKKVEKESNIPSKEEESAPASFLRRLRQNVAETVSRPVPGLIKIRNTDLNQASSAVSAFINSAILNNGKESAAEATAKPTSPLPPTQLKSSTSQATNTTATPAYKVSQFESLLYADNVDLQALRKLSWNGVPQQYRTMSWQLMLGYLPTNKSRRDNTILRKRKEYRDAVALYYEMADADRTTQDGEILRQILVDIPRTSPHSPLFQQKRMQKCMERILYIWSIRHPASGYVQGIDDLVTPLIYISLAPYVDGDVMRCDTEKIEMKVLTDVEADSYWCLTKLLDNIQDHYTFSQPGLQRMMLRLEDLVHRLDADLHDHFQNENVQYFNFSFRWMNCLLLRELPLRAILRLWDTYLAEENGGFENFHVYVCVVILKTFEEKLLKMQFQDLLMFLQALPTTAWTEEDVEPILSQAYILSTLFENSPSHLS
jgi:TBC1 domain family member 2